MATTGAVAFVLTSTGYATPFFGPPAVFYFIVLSYAFVTMLISAATTLPFAFATLKAKDAVQAIFVTIGVHALISFSLWGVAYAVTGGNFGRELFRFWFPLYVGFVGSQIGVMSLARSYGYRIVSGRELRDIRHGEQEVAKSH